MKLRRRTFKHPQLSRYSLKYVIIQTISLVLKDLALKKIGTRLMVVGNFHDGTIVFVIPSISNEILANCAIQSTSNLTSKNPYILVFIYRIHRGSLKNTIHPLGFKSYFSYTLSLVRYLPCLQLGISANYADVAETDQYIEYTQRLQTHTLVSSCIV